MLLKRMCNVLFSMFLRIGPQKSHFSEKTPVSGTGTIMSLSFLYVTGNSVLEPDINSSHFEGSRREIILNFSHLLELLKP